MKTNFSHVLRPSAQTFILVAEAYSAVAKVAPFFRSEEGTDKTKTKHGSTGKMPQTNGFRIILSGAGQPNQHCVKSPGKGLKVAELW